MEREQFLEALLGTVRVVAAQNMASAFIVGIEVSADEGRPLTQLQQKDMLASVLLAYSDVVKETTDYIQVDALMDAAKEMGMVVATAFGMWDQHPTAYKAQPGSPKATVEMKLTTPEGMAIEDCMQEMSRNFGVETQLLKRAKSATKGHKVLISGSEEAVAAVLKNHFEATDEQIAAALAAEEVEDPSEEA